MFEKLLKHSDLPARVALSAIFILSGVSKVSAYQQTAAYMEAFGLPGVLLTPTIIFEVCAGLAILLGFKIRLFAFLLSGFALVTALIFHSNFGDQIQMIMFLKNITMAGGLLLLSKVSASEFSLDRLIALRKGVEA